MRRIHVCAFVAVTLGLPAVAAEGVELSLQSRSAAAAASVPHKSVDAPFKAGGRDPLPEILLREELDKRGPRGSCELSASDVCYDTRDGKLVYRRAREFMPRVQGLQAESVSLKRNRITFKYSF